MVFDAVKNFSYSSVATPPSPATSGTSVVLLSGDGANFPAAPFNVTIWPAGAIPTVANAEIARVTAISTDTLTITRATESTVARAIVVGDQIALTITAKMVTDLQSQLGGAVQFGTGTDTTPNGHITCAGPALAVMTDGSLWAKFDTTNDNLNWMPVIQP